MPKITTNRLTIRPYEDSDAAAFYTLFADPETMRFMHVLPHESEAQTRGLFETDVRLGSEYWTVRLRDAGEVVGFVQFLGGTRVPGLGYMLRRDHWGQGLMTEALGAMLTHAFNGKGLDRVELWINEGNRASQRVAEKLGFRLKGRIHQRYDWEENHHIMLCYGLWADEWGETETPPERPQPAFFGAQPVLVVKNVPESITFYADKLGFEVDFTVGDPANHAGLARGSWSADMAYLQVTEASESTEIRPQGWLYFMVDARIDRLFEAYEAAGVEIIRPPKTYPWGMREFSIRDLDGNELRFGTRASE